ncbi:hypothetical protein [Terasakiella pusilla]|uniref:hypothetical protein n=1 Tax=Terasakiella pusilla TaxID=64973 RepID=UPI003AA820B1
MKYGKQNVHILETQNNNNQQTYESSPTGLHKHFIYTPFHNEPIEQTFLNVAHIDPDQTYTLMLVDDDSFNLIEVTGQQIIVALGILKQAENSTPNFYNLAKQTANTFTNFIQTRNETTQGVLVNLMIGLVFLQKNYVDFAGLNCIAFEVHLYTDEQEQQHLEIYGTSNKEAIEQSLQMKQKLVSQVQSTHQFKREKGSPRPNRFSKTMKMVQNHFLDNSFENATRCMNDGAIYVIDDITSMITNPDEIVTSLCALANFDKLHLPHSHIWIEQAAPIKASDEFGYEEDVYISIAAYETAQGFSFTVFWEGLIRKGISLFACTISFINDEAVLHIEVGDDYAEEFNQSADSFNVAANILMDFLFLLNCQAVEIKTISHHKRPRQAANSNRSSKKKRDYTLIRFSRYVSDKSKSRRKNEGPYRYIIRSAHIWGKYTRPIEQQQWRDATLVRIPANDNNANTIKTPRYRMKKT